MRALIAIACLGVTGCDMIPAPADTDQAVDMSGAITMLPGIYEVTGDVAIIDFAGLDADAKEAMRRRTSTPSRGCIDKDDLDNAEETFFRGPFNDCAYERMTMKNGEISGLMRCANGESRSELTISGTNHSAGYQMTIDMRTQRPSGRMQWTQRAKRVAACR